MAESEDKPEGEDGDKGDNKKEGEDGEKDKPRSKKPLLIVGAIVVVEIGRAHV